MDTKTSFKDSGVRLIALLGLLLVLLLGAWGIILLAFNLPSIASTVGNSIVSLFNYSPGAGADSLAVFAPKSVQSGSVFEVSWNADTNEQSAYTVSYACKSGLAIKAPMPNGQYQTAPCSTPFNYINAGNKMALIATVTGTDAAEATIVVSQANVSDGAVVASGSTNVEVTPKTVVSTTPTTNYTPSSTYIPAANSTANLYGYADLAVRILSINSLSSVQGRVALQFEVANIGTNVAPQGWMFSANLPVGYAYTYSSPTQVALYPGDKIVYTLGFNPAYQNQYCTMQYPNYNCPQQYNQQYQGYQYQNTCYRYDGYQNIPVACAGSDENIYNNNYNYGNNYNNNLVTIVADPSNRVYD